MFIFSVRAAACNDYLIFSKITSRNTSGPVAQWIRRLTTDQEIPGSSPGRIGLHFLKLIKLIFFLNNLFSKIYISISLKNSLEKF